MDEEDTFQSIQVRRRLDEMIDLLQLLLDELEMVSKLLGLIRAGQLADRALRGSPTKEETP